MDFAGIIIAPKPLLRLGATAPPHLQSQFQSEPLPMTMTRPRAMTKANHEQRGRRRLRVNRKPSAKNVARRKNLWGGAYLWCPCRMGGGNRECFGVLLREWMKWWNDGTSSSSRSIIFAYLSRQPGSQAAFVRRVKALNWQLKIRSKGIGGPCKNLILIEFLISGGTRRSRGLAGKFNLPLNEPKCD